VKIGATNIQYQPECIMMTAKTPFLTKVSCGLSIALLALALTSHISPVRAQTDALAPTWLEMFVNPIADAVKALGERLSSLEAKVAASGLSFTSRQITAHELCLADDEGGRTCINKAQLDGLLKTMQTAAIDESATVTNSVTKQAELLSAAPAMGAKASGLERPVEIETTGVTDDATRRAAVDWQDELEEDGVFPTTSGRALVSHPDVEINLP
jgi:hypothetical protein